MSVNAKTLIPGLLTIGILLLTTNQLSAQASRKNAKTASNATNESRVFKTIEKADALWKSGEVDKAVAIYENLAATNNNPTIFNTLGGLYAYQKRYQEAASTYTKALDLDPDFATASYNLSIAYYHLKKFKKSLPPAVHAAKLRPENLKINTHLCEVRSTIAKNDNAIKCFEQLELKFAPFPRTRVSHALLLIETDNSKKAIVLLEDTVRIFPKHAVAHNVLGMAYLKKKEISSAIKELQRAIEIDPNLSFTRFNLAYAYLLKKDKKAALEQYQILKKLNKELAERFYRILYSDKVIFADALY